MNATHKIILGLVLVVLVGAGGWWAFSSQSGDDLSNLSANAGAKLTDSQVQTIISRVSKFMVVPSDEKPSVVVLRDVASLASQQPFYRDAKDGDVLLVYSTRAIVYDAKENKLVSVTPIQPTPASPSPVASGSAEASLTPSPSSSPIAPEKVIIEVRNGTSTAGLAGKLASDLKKNAWVTKTTTGDAKGTYSTTVLVDMSKGKKPGAIAALEGILGVKSVTALPKGEAATVADFLIIVGK